MIIVYLILLFVHRFEKIHYNKKVKKFAVAIMSDQKALQQALQTVYRNKEGKKVTRGELLEERAKEKKVKVLFFIIYSNSNRLLKK